MTTTQSAREDEEQPADEKQNIATIANVIVIVFLIKCNESYGEKINNISNNSIEGLLKPAKIYKLAFGNTYNYDRYMDLSEQRDPNANKTFNFHSISIDKIKKYPTPQNLNFKVDGNNLINGTSYSINSHSILDKNKPTSITFSETPRLIGSFPNINNLFNRKKNVIGENIDNLQRNKFIKILRKKSNGDGLNEPSTVSKNYLTNNITRQTKELQRSITDVPNTSSRFNLRNIYVIDPLIIAKKNKSDKHRLLNNYTKNDWNITSKEMNTQMRLKEDGKRYSTKLDSDAGYTETLDSIKEVNQVRRFKRQDVPPNPRKKYKSPQKFTEDIIIKNTIQKTISNKMPTKLPKELIKEIKGIAKRIQKSKLVGTSGETGLIDQLKNKVTICDVPIQRTMKKLQESHCKFSQNNTFEDNVSESSKKEWLMEQRQNNTFVDQKGVMNKQNKGTVMWQRGGAPKRSLLYKPPSRGGALKIKRQRDVKLDVDRYNALINKRKRTTIKNKRLKNVPINKGSRGLNIKIFQVKSVDNEQQQYTKKPTKAQDTSFRIDNIKKTFSLTTEITELIQSLTKTSNDSIIKDELDLMSKESNHLVLKQHSLSNDQLASNIHLSNIGTANSENLMTEMATNSGIVIADLMQPVFQTIRYTVDTQPVNKSDYLPGLFNLDHSNNNISIKSMPFAPSGIINTNKTMENPKIIKSAKKINRRGKHFKNSKHHKKGHATKGKRENVSKGRKKLQKNAAKNVKSHRNAKPLKKFKSHIPSNINVKASGENFIGSKTKTNEKNIKNISGKSHKTTRILPRFTPNVQERSLDLINRTAELQFREKDLNVAAYDTVGGVFNSYNNNWNNDNNYYYYASSAITDRNNVNNLIVINFDTTPEPEVKSTITTLLEEEEPEVTCPSAVRPTVTFLKRTGFMDYNVVVAALFIGSLMLLFLCCCCCAPIIIIRRKRCET